jgi:hypothetical protein
MRRKGLDVCVLAECVERRVVSEMGETEYMGVGVGVEMGRKGVGEDIFVSDLQMWCVC